jgi:hypothetical protein
MLIGKIRRFLSDKGTLKLRNIKPRKWYSTDVLITEAAFQTLVNYVENDCAWIELKHSDRKYSKWSTIKFVFFPYRFKSAFVKELGIAHLREHILNTGYFEQSKLAGEVLDLYQWYTTEYPLFRDPYMVEEAPEQLFIDAHGNITKDMIAKNHYTGEFFINKFHPDYVEYLRRCSDAIDAQHKIIDIRFRQLLRIRRSLWI